MNENVKAHCYICGSENTMKVSDRLRNDTDGQFPMRPYSCGDCGIVFLYPQMTEEREAHFYQNEFRRLYHGDNYDIEEFHRRGIIEAGRRRIMCQEQGLLRGSVMEVGSATGYFLEFIRNDVERCFGIEPDARAREFANARGIETLERLEDAKERWVDAIVLFHVLEHVRRPVEFMAQLRDMLNVGGSIIVEVPNVKDALLTQYDIPEFKEFYWHPAHNYYFSNETLLNIAGEAGLKALAYPVQRYSLQNHLHWALKKRPGGGKDWLNGLISEETNAAYANDLCSSFLCDTIWLVAKKV